MRTDATVGPTGWLDGCGIRNDQYTVPRRAGIRRRHEYTAQAHIRSERAKPRGRGVKRFAIYMAPRPNRGVGEKRPPRGGGSGAAKSEIWHFSQTIVSFSLFLGLAK